MALPRVVRRGRLDLVPDSSRGAYVSRICLRRSARLLQNLCRKSGVPAVRDASTDAVSAF